MDGFFNCGGRYQQLEKSDGFFQSFAPPNMKLEELEVDPSVRRLAAIEATNLMPVIQEAISAGAGVDLSAIEEAYCCTAVQEQMLRTHAENPRLYIVRSIWEISTSDGAPTDRARFEDAWRQVVGLDSTLRTRFVALREGEKQHSHFGLVEKEPRERSLARGRRGSSSEDARTAA
ncbi:hypothetical protein MPH_11608 [Macrophomina phaseolina MS6]|uniref:Uncharacterized protein n=1 Tax=Macrophomina phaseolina (strain MS6) TaxID=1126212 RepID=K2RM54_MACPH|nr:hypothetical protein MPH_11608 [Macrophomina phaseolina MS6]